MHLPSIRSFDHLFPFPSIRKEQRTAIERILKAFDAGKRWVVCQLPTGSGKSAIAVTVARALQTDAYILTTQKVLQDQYTDDFGPKRLNLVQSIKSASNYDCNGFWGQSCGETRRVLSILKSSKAGIPSSYQACQQSCVYKECKEAFVNSPIGVTNFAYFLAETMYAHQLKPRGLLVVDEAHNAEQALSSFIEVTFSLRFAKQQLKCNGPRSKTQDGVHAWIKGAYKKALTAKAAEIEEQIEQMASSGRSEEDASTLAKRYELLDKHLCKVNRFLADYDPDNWIMNAVAPDVEKKGTDWRFEFKPIDVSPYAEDALYRYGDRVLLMSATIIDHKTFCSTIGIDPKDAEFIELPSSFPPENRAVHYMPVGSMSKKNVDKTMPNMLDAIRSLLDHHRDEKGIIHCSSFRIARAIFDGIRDPRFLIHDSQDREATLQHHVESDEPTVILSPSMTEGVDLRDDASRWQIIAKIPFPYLGDEMTKKRMARNPRWYNFVTARVIIQSLGRSVRSETDHAVSYILDADWKRFYEQSIEMFNADFRNAYHG